jgi:hypothetical protein
MGTVSDYVRDLIGKQINDHGIVVWFDPERYYEDFVREFSIPYTKLVCYSDSFFALRREIEPLLDSAQPPRLLAYVSLDQAVTHHALAEVEAAGVVLRPGQQPPSRNTRLSIVARNALKPLIGDQAALEIEKQVEAKKLSLADLDRLAEEGVAIGTGVVSVIFGSGNPMEVALSFLASPRHDEELMCKDAVYELAQLLHSAFGIEIKEDVKLDELRSSFARHVLSTELVNRLEGATPSQLALLKTAATPATREACNLLARNWRGSRECRDGYAAHANRVEKEIGLSSLKFHLNQAAKIETFREIEGQLQRDIEAGLLNDPHDDLVAIARTRQSSFWAEHLPRMQARWSLVAAAGQLLLEAQHIEKSIKAVSSGADAIMAAYTSGDRPWCLMDTYHRHMERRWHNFEFDPGTSHESLEQLVIRARQRFMEVGGKLSEMFVRRLQEAGFRLSRLQQRQVFEKKVKPWLAQGKIAFIAVDALRFEMARELAETLTDEFTANLDSGMAAVPTITPVGMAALLPDAEDAFGLRVTGPGQIGVEMGGTLLRDRKDRINYLRAKSGVKVFDAKLEDLLPKPKKKTQQGIEDADLVFITSQEIDALCEGDNIPMARRFMDEILHDLRRACRILANLGVKRIIFAADHGYLFGDELASDMKIDPPGGETVDLHRRIWMGRGGAASKSYLRTPISSFGIDGEFDIAAPWNFACFRMQGGAKAYFHGGLSPQELLIPVMTLTPAKQPPSSAAAEMEWKLVPGSQKISTRFLSVQIIGKSKTLLHAAPQKVRIEVRMKSALLSVPVSSSYGFEEATGDVQLRVAEDNPYTLEPNTVTLMVTQPQQQQNVDLVLLDAGSGRTLESIDQLEMTITM